MSNLSIVKVFEDNYFIEDTCLRKECSPVKIEDLNKPWFKQLINDMFETLYTAPFGSGLSANQVGVMLKVSVIDIKREAKSPMVLINPSYSPLSEEMMDSSEACLSVSNCLSTVKRYSKVLVNYIDLKGEQKQIECEGFKSKLFQHEIDHLYGKLSIDLATTYETTHGTPYYQAEKALKKLLENNE